MFGIARVIESEMKGSAVALRFTSGQDTLLAKMRPKSSLRPTTF